jgi:hypothetical protein
MNLRLLVTITLLFLLAGCAHFVPGASPARGRLPASDLDALVSSVGRDLKTRTLPNGKTYCAEDSNTRKSLDECVGDLEDLAFFDSQDKTRAMATLKLGVSRIKLMREPCRWLEFRCKAEARILNNTNKPQEQP